MFNIKYNFSIKKIFKLMPHRYPLLLVDKILIFKKFQNICGIKNVTINEPYFLGHFNEDPIFPGVLIIESMAQVAGILILKSFNYKNYKKNFFLTRINKTFFKKSVIPGDQMFLHVSLLRIISNNFFFYGRAIVNNYLICKSEFTCFF